MNVPSVPFLKHFGCMFPLSNLICLARVKYETPKICSDSHQKLTTTNRVGRTELRIMFIFTVIIIEDFNHLTALDRR